MFPAMKYIKKYIRKDIFFFHMIHIENMKIKAKFNLFLMLLLQSKQFKWQFKKSISKLNGL